MVDEYEAAYKRVLEPSAQRRGPEAVVMESVGFGD
jgi:hypothetical protein